jgi:hypothetical protein
MNTSGHIPDTQLIIDVDQADVISGSLGSGPINGTFDPTVNSFSILCPNYGGDSLFNLNFSGNAAQPKLAEGDNSIVLWGTWTGDRLIIREVNGRLEITSWTTGSGLFTANLFR